MDAEKVINQLLKDSTALAAEVSNRIFGGLIPLKTQLPAVAYNHISTVEEPTIDAAAQYALVTSRIQITVAAKSYAKQKELIKIIRKACNYKRGIIAGIIVNAIIRDVVGPDLRDDESGLFFQTIDFRVTYHELN